MNQSGRRNKQTQSLCPLAPNLLTPASSSSSSPRVFQNIVNDRSLQTGSSARPLAPLLPNYQNHESASLRNDENVNILLTPPSSILHTTSRRRHRTLLAAQLPPSRTSQPRISPRRRNLGQRQERRVLAPMDIDENDPDEAIYVRIVPDSLPLARQQYKEPQDRHSLGAMDIPCSHCNALHWDAEKTRDSRIGCSKFGICCNHGKVVLPEPSDPPLLIRSLLLDNTAQAREFRLHIRQYNSALAFTSIGFKPDETITESRGVYVFRIQGELYHLSGSLLPSEGRQPQYAQLYIYDPSSALNQRMARNSARNRETMESLQTMLLETHFYAGLFKNAAQIMRESSRIANVTLAIRADRSRDMRRYNLPAVDEVSAILPGDCTGQLQSRDIILRRQDGPMQRISEGHPSYEPLHYVLMNPYGEDGWSWDMRLNLPESSTRPRNKLTHTAYHAYRMQYRQNTFPTLLLCGRLFQQYVVDMWAQAEQENLRWVVNNQKTIRVELYSGLEDALDAEDHNGLERLGRRVILPSSFVGGPRYMNQLYQDAMAAARYFKKIDLFITVTANPKWPEITDNLLPNQTAADRPDLVVRVFLLKKKAIIDDICQNHVFGKVASYVYSIEFQKRGLPHMHLLLFLERESKLLQPNDIDTAVRAEWPDPTTEPKLFETVKHCMIHGPCGAANPNAPCMEDGKCTKDYPKSFQPATILDGDGYPLYRRTDNDTDKYDINGFIVDNRWIVPYNPFLTAKYDCHINVESAASFASIKYVHKYIYKGHDCATLEIDRENEPKRYIDARYISPPEAVWRIYHFDLHKQYPNIVRLQIHLPSDHSIMYNSDDDENDVLERGRSMRTILTEFFALCNSEDAVGNFARHYTYQEFPQHFTWHKTPRKWTIRKQGFAIGRIYYVSPLSGELFYLRTLLTVVRGPRSFVDLRTVNGVVHETYHSACLALGLLADDGEWRLCLAEAAEMQTGAQARQLFCTILLFCEPAQPETLWNEFWVGICDDLSYRLRTLGIANPSEDDVYDYGLYTIDLLLQDRGHSLDNFPSMPHPRRPSRWGNLTTNRLIGDQLSYDANAEADAYRYHSLQLNADQHIAVEKISESITRAHGQIFFLHGPAGTGKTFVYKTLCHMFRKDASIILCVASSGIAALLLPGGRTSHSMFKIPIDNLNEQSSCPIPVQSQLADLIREAKAIIWDEVIMQHRHGPEAVSRTCQDIRQDIRPFGGLTVIFGGDFQQILPVVVRGSREQIVAASLQRSSLWENIQIVSLSQNMRLQRGDTSEWFAQWLLDVGHGRTTDENNNINFPDHMRVPNVESLMQFIYPGICTNPPPPAEYFQHRVILSARNDDVEDLNIQMLKEMVGDEIVFYSSDSALYENGADMGRNEQPPEVLRSLTPNGLPPGELHLKIGCPLILLRNLSPRDGLCNGTRMILLRATQRVLEVRIIGGQHDGEIAFIPRIMLTPSLQQTGLNFVLQRRQFPVRLAFAMSINKAQGQSVKYIGLDLRIPVFTHGQLYVALSRATSADSIRVLLPDTATSSQTTNIVYPEVLLDSC